MKVDGGEAKSIVQEAYSGESSQVHNRLINGVIVANQFINVVPGTFKMFKTPGAKGFFMRFKSIIPLVIPERVVNYEIFPAALQGVTWEDEPPKESESKE